MSKGRPPSVIPPIVVVYRLNYKWKEKKLINPK